MNACAQCFLFSCRVSVIDWLTLLGSIAWVRYGQILYMDLLLLHSTLLESIQFSFIVSHDSLFPLLLSYPGNVFVVSLAFADLVVAFYPYPLVLYAIFHDGWSLGDTQCKVSLDSMSNDNLVLTVASNLDFISAVQLKSSHLYLYRLKSQIKGLYNQCSTAHPHSL